MTSTVFHAYLVKKNSQNGAVILLTVVLLLIMVTLVTLYTGKIQSFEHSIAINDQNQKLADAAARAGLARALAILAVSKKWPTLAQDEQLPDTSTFSSVATSTTLSDGRKLININSTGYSADGLAKSTLSQQAVIYPLLFNLPLSPLMVADGLALANQFEIGLNPNGLGPSEPLAIWTDVPITLNHNQFSCLLSDFYAANCQANAYSDVAVKQFDIVDNSSRFPADILAYLFNVASNQWHHLNELADSQLSDCDSLDNASLGFIWVNGDCIVSGNSQIASETAPIVLLVFDGNVLIQSKSVIYGLLLAFKPAHSTQSLDIHMQSQAMVAGLVLANFKLGANSGLVRVAHNAHVSSHLKSHHSLQRVARVPGSWRDF